MNPIPQQLLICGTALFLLSLLMGFAIPVFANPRMGVEMHVTGLQSGMALWALGLMWQRVALPAGAERPAQILALAGLYATFISLLLAAIWGTSRATPIAGAGHQASHLREVVVTVLLTGGSLATVAAVALVLWAYVRMEDLHLRLPPGDGQVAVPKTSRQVSKNATHPSLGSKCTSSVQSFLAPPQVNIFARPLEEYLLSAVKSFLISLERAMRIEIVG
jgi:(hydroxyamino)benzene mutase